MTGRILTSIDAKLSVASAWSRLLTRSGFDDVFGSLEFYAAWWQSFGADRELRIALWPADGEPRIIAPFYFERSAPRIWRLLGDKRGDYNHVLCAPECANELNDFFAWLRREGNWTRLILRRIPATAPVADYRGALSQVSSARTHPRLARPMLDKCRDKIETRHYRGDRRWFDRVRPLRYERVTGAALTLSLLEQFMGLHVREWRGQNAQSQFERAEERAYLVALHSELSARDAIHLDALWWGDDLIAAHVGFRWARREYYYKPCYDPAIERSPGKLLLGYLLARAAADPGIDEFDFLNGLEAYKVQQASDLRETRALDIYRTGLALNVDRVRRRLTRWSARAP